MAEHLDVTQATLQQTGTVEAAALIAQQTLLVGLAIAAQDAAAEAAKQAAAFLASKTQLLALIGGSKQAMQTDLSRKLLLKLPNPEIVAMDGQPLTAEMRSMCFNNLRSDAALLNF